MTLPIFKDWDGESPIILFDNDSVINVDLPTWGKELELGNITPDGSSFSFRIRWNEKLIKEIKKLHNLPSQPSLIWSTTWVNDAHKLNELLGVKIPFVAFINRENRGSSTIDDMKAKAAFKAFKSPAKAVWFEDDEFVINLFFSLFGENVDKNEVKKKIFIPTLDPKLGITPEIWETAINFLNS